MKANEVRNGNLVLDSSGNVREVDHADELGQSMWFKRNSGDYPKYYSSLDNCKPIPITEDWLLKFGFKKFEHLPFDAEYFKSGITIVFKDNQFKFDRFGNQRQYTIIEYVHELQNLFYALNGKELTVKENATAL